MLYFIRGRAVSIPSLLMVAVPLLTVAASSPAAAAQRDDAALWRPRLPTPAIVALDTPQNREFVAEVRATAAARNWTAAIANDLNSWNCDVVSADYAKINRGTEPGWRITIRVPAGTSPELFDLTVTSTEGTSVQNQSVSVEPAFATDFYILHLADEQIVNQKHTDPTGQYYRTVGTAEEMRWMQEPINLVHPRFVFITGDQIDFNGALDGWNNWHNWHYEPGAKRYFSKAETLEIEDRLSEMYRDCHRGYRVPYVEAPGNHDVTPTDKKLLGTDILWHPISVQAYESYFGQRTWSFRMGDFYVLMHDWSERYLKDWADADYAAASADPTVTFRLIGQHFIDDQGFVPDSCDLMLVGHGHRTATLKTQPYYIYMDGPAFVYGMTGFFNFRRTSDGWTCDQTAAPRDTSKDVWPLFTDNGVTKKVRCDQPDPMNVTTNSVTITNDLPREFYDGRVRFVLSKGEYRSVQNGVILAQYDCANGANTALVVKVDIPPNDTIAVTVAPPSK
jgi:hypothetical protein